MTESFGSAAAKAGFPPGELVHVGIVHGNTSRVTVIDYDQHNIVEHQVRSIDDLRAYVEAETVTWVNVEGLQNIELIEAIGRRFNIHPLVLEDILNTQQRPKFEQHDTYAFIVVKGMTMDSVTLAVEHEQISIVVLDNLVFTFKEKSDDVFGPIKQRLQDSQGRLRNFGAGYLTYVIMDMVVDQYFALGDALEDQIEAIEDELLDQPTAATMAAIQKIKKELILIRKSISPLRELLAEILRRESSLIDERTAIYFRDVYDHVIRNIETIELYRDLITGMLDIYLSSISNKMNETMKILTVFASIFIPLTFIAGIYGMNFEYMPELKWKWSYPLLWVAFLVIPVVLLRYFRRRQWL